MVKRTRKPTGPLAAWMEAEGYTQEKLAALIRVSPSVMSRILAGKRRATPTQLSNLARLTGKSMEALYVMFSGKRVA